MKSGSLSAGALEKDIHHGRKEALEADKNYQRRHCQTTSIWKKKRTEGKMVLRAFRNSVEWFGYLHILMDPVWIPIYKLHTRGSLDMIPET